MKPPTVSIVLPVYNGEKFLAESIESILAQTLPHWELIIVDDCSTDASHAIAQAYARQDARIRVLRNGQNQRLPASLNRGFREARGTYYTWTSDDNRFLPPALATMVEALEQSPGTAMVSANCAYIDEHGHITGHMADTFRTRKPIDLIFENNIMACFMYRSAAAHAIGEYDRACFGAEDYDYWLRLALEHGITYLGATLYHYRYHDRSLTATRAAMVQQKAWDIRARYFLPFLQKFNLPDRELFRKAIHAYRLSKRKEFRQIARAVQPALYYLHRLSVLAKKTGHFFYRCKRWEEGNGSFTQRRILLIPLKPTRREKG